MTKKRFAFGTVTGTGNLRGDPAFTLGFDGYLRDKEVDPRTVDLVTIASCAGRSFVISQKANQRILKSSLRRRTQGMAPSVMAHIFTMTRVF